MRVLNPKLMNMDNIRCLTQLQNIENKIKLKHKEWGFLFFFFFGWVFLPYSMTSWPTINICQLDIGGS
jgi:hypothetical protein